MHHDTQFCNYLFPGRCRVSSHADVTCDGTWSRRWSCCFNFSSSNPDSRANLEDAAANETLAKDVLLAYDEFILTYPHAEQIPELLFKSGEVLKGLGAHLKSAKAFHKVHTQFPNTKIAPIALFHQAHCFEALDQHLTAKNTYEDFIERYPKHPYVSQANGMIQILNLSDEELIYKFQN